LTPRRGDGLTILVAVAALALGTAGPSLASGAASPQSHQGNPSATESESHGNPNGKPQTNPSPTHGKPANGKAQGIVQSVADSTVVVTQLDGSSVSVDVSPATHVFVNGNHASVGDLKPGYVVSAVWAGGKTRVLQAFDLSSAGAVGVGVVQSISTKAIVVRRSDGTTVTLHIGPSTRVLLDGDKSKLGGVKVGDTVVFATRDAKSGKAAGQLRFLRPV
jgi:hypothetical protein